MKRFIISLFGVLSVIVFFSLCYYVSYLDISNKIEKEKDQLDISLQEFIVSEKKRNQLNDGLSEPLQSAEALNDDAIVTADTICVYVLRDISTGEQSRYETKPGADLAGLTRTQLVQKLDVYMENLPISEYEAGLISYEVISFSPKQVLMQKIYESNKVRYKYIVTIKNDEVIVYYSDNKTVYEYTGITTCGLSDEICFALQEGVKINNIEQLYDYLSGITS